MPFASTYACYPLDDLESAIDEGVRALGRANGVELSFAFVLLDERIDAEPLPDAQPLLDLMDRPRALRSA